MGRGLLLGCESRNDCDTVVWALIDGRTKEWEFRDPVLGWEVWIRDGYMIGMNGMLGMTFDV